MATTLTYGVTTQALDDNLLWSDELDWRPVEQRSQRTLTGALVIEAALNQGGRPITLSDGWMARSVVDTLMTWLALPGQTFTLALRGVNHTVVFDHERGGIEAVPVVDYEPPDPSDLYAVTLRFLKV